MTRIANLIAAPALAALLLAAAAQAAPETPHVGIVGQVIAITGGATVTHANGQKLAAEPYQPLYTGDLVQVTAANGSATLEFAGGGDVKVTHAQPYRVNARGAGGSASTFMTFMQKWGYVLQPKTGMHTESTTPKGVRSAVASGLAASRYLPLTKQQMYRARILPVVWMGDPAAVVLKDGTGNVVAQAAPGQNGFALVDCKKSLPAGEYQIEIGAQPSGPLVIQVTVVQTTPPSASTNEEGAMQAADALDGAPGGRLQALAQLQNLAEKSYLASAVMKAVQAGE
ncbi:MAG TPA: hypothetical protein VG407_12925 [Caulobacteraceae bacterium]|jgi:hypothetical protein|nr:hypothetical protein [Caulobacteraceae bacterium]